MIRHTMRNPIAAVALIVGLLISAARAENWPQWRGPHFNGSSQSKNLPDKLDDSTRLWESKLPGGGAGTPLIWGDRIFLSCLDAQSKKLLGMCLGARDGKVIWSKEIGQGFRQNDRNDMASPSPVTDGKRVWFYFGTGDLAAFDTDGNEKWSRNIQKDFGDFNVQWIYASSPLLYKDKLYIQVLQRDVPPFARGYKGPPADSFLLAIDPQTGKDIWRVVRPNEAVQESKESYGTPIPHEYNGHDEILLVGGDCITAHDPQTGKEIWRAGGWNPRKIPHWRMVSSPSAFEDFVFVCPPKGEPMFAVKDGGDGDVTSTHIAWKNKDLSTDVCVPLIYKDHLYVLNGDSRKLFCADPKTGNVLWSGPLGGHAVFRASPTGADNKIYCMNEVGDLWVLSAGEFKVLSKSSLSGDRSRASVAVADGLVLVRSGNTLVAFANK